MARGRGGGPQRPVKGFRPGKEPPRLRKQRAKQQLGDVTPAQEKLIEMFAERTPEEALAMMRRWRIGLLIGAIVLGVLGAVLYTWSVVAAVLVHIIAAIVLFFWWRLHRQRDDFETMAEMVSGSGQGRRKRR